MAVVAEGALDDALRGVVLIQAGGVVGGILLPRGLGRRPMAPYPSRNPSAIGCRAARIAGARPPTAPSSSA